MSQSSLPAAMVGLDLLDKRELSVVGISLNSANLHEMASAVAAVLGFAEKEVLVTDVLNGVVTFDILRRSIYAHQLMLHSDDLLDALRAVPGVELKPDAHVDSRGVLGWIAADSGQLETALATAAEQAARIESRIARRVRLFSTGAEVANGEIEDTNRHTAKQVLSEAGYEVSFGGALRDDIDLIAGSIRRAVDDGYGVIITTGGVGAESKDRTVEAVESLDPQAATPYLCHFQHDEYRHIKDGVRIAVGELYGSVIVSLPGPNEEVSLALPLLRDGLGQGFRRMALAQPIAERLRTHLRQRMVRHHSADHERHS